MDSLIQMTGSEPVTPGCRGARGRVMAAAGMSGESQLQRIIRDLHGTSTLPLDMSVCVCGYMSGSVVDTAKRKDEAL